MGFHQDAHTKLCIQFDEFFLQCRLADVLHTHVDGAHQVVAIHRFLVHYIHILRTDATLVEQTALAAQQSVIGKFQTRTRRVLCSIHLAEGTTSQGTKRFLTVVTLLHDESTLVFTADIEDWQLTQLIVLDVIQNIAWTHIKIASMLFHAKLDVVVVAC